MFWEPIAKQSRTQTHFKNNTDIQADTLGMKKRGKWVINYHYLTVR